MHVSKTLVVQVLLPVMLIGLVFSPALVEYLRLRPVRSVSLSSVVQTPAHPKPQMLTLGSPVSLKIPKINVDAALDYVGLTSQGELGVPAGPTHAAWYDRGPRPGEIGNAVIDGHFGYKNNIPAVFDNLHKLQEGDDLYVKDDKGLTTTFVVSAIQTLSDNQDDTNVFHSKDGKAHLNLITCQGTWSEAQKSYANRLVVFADKIAT